MAKFGALDNKTVGEHSREDFRKVQESQGFLCFYCATPICEKSADPKCEATPDHLRPLSRGGVDYIWNIVAACLTCNQLKGAKMPGEFLRERWVFAQGLENSPQVPTAIPFIKKRGKLPEYDGDGNIVESHLQVPSFFASAAINLARTKRFATESESDNAYSQRRYERKRMLLSQAASMQRRFVEQSGQLSLNFDAPKPVASCLAATEAPTLVFKSMQVTG